jgi:tRNA threonylcarbamoyladenosine modification (KEOPS) complex Cgi121 subunit
LLKYIEEFKKCIAIVGFKNAEIKNVQEFLEKTRKQTPPETEVQFFNGDLVATWQHLYFAVLNALTAFKNKTNISKTLAVETMLYASAQHQIRRAVELLGIKPNTRNIAMVVLGRDVETVEAVVSAVSRSAKSQDDSVLKVTKAKARKIRDDFGISDTEVETMKKDSLEEALVDLVIERMALLATQR